LAERLALLAAVAAFSSWHWQQLERPESALWEFAALSLLAAAPAIVAALGRRWAAVATAVVATAVSIWIGFRYVPWQRGHHHVYPMRVALALRDGARAWFDTATPFDPLRFPATKGLVAVSFFVLLAVFAWLLLRGRHGLTAVAAAFALFAIPSTSVQMAAAGFRAGLFLLIAIAILAVSQRRVPAGLGALGQLAALAVATVIAGLVVGSAPGVAKGAFFDWRHWNPLAGSGPRVSVGYVWYQDYAPLIWPKKRVTVFEVSSSKPHYWKATVLDAFENGRWVLQPSVTNEVHGSRSIAIDNGALPPKAIHPDKPSDIIQIGIKIDALADPYLLSTGQPIRYDTGSPVDAILYQDGSVKASGDPERGAAYSVRAYAPDPTPRQLAAAGTTFPSEVATDVTVGTATIPPWHTSTSSTAVKVNIDPSLIQASNQVWHASGADDPTSSEYGVVAAVESFFHGKQFHYDQTPPAPHGIPALADFMLNTHRGYCQQFSGAMALVLRLHGIPARVAVGFTEGALTGFDHYTVSDRDAHSWVEVYFPHYGWIPFEPTKGSTLPIQTSTTDKGWAQAVGDRQQGSNIGLPVTLTRLRLGSTPVPTGPHQPHVGRSDSAPGTVVAAPQHHSSFFLWALSAAAILVAVLAVLKLLAVRWRYLRRGPRGQASAAYHELATYIGDQGVTVSANATFEDLARAVEQAWGVDASALASAGSAARYAPPKVAASAGRRVRPELRRVRRELRSAIELRDRLTGALRLRSMLAQTTHLD